MTSAIATLTSEHRVIETVLDALETYADVLAEGGQPHPEDLEEFLSFLHEFADLKHHGKEEHVLFVAMDESGLPHTGGPVATMVHEHNVERELVATLRACAKEEWSDDERGTIVAAVRELSNLLREHIAKEERVLYPMAVEALSDQSMRSVDTTCEKLERDSANSGDSARLEALATKLSDKYR